MGDATRTPPNGSVISADYESEAGLRRQPAENSDAASPSKTKATKRQQILAKLRSAICGLVLMLITAVSWVGMTQFAQLTYNPLTYQAPFFLVYFSTSWLVIFYPLYSIGALLYTKGQISLKETFREGINKYRSETDCFIPFKLLGQLSLFCLIWTVTNYMYVRALNMYNIQPVDVVSLFATSPSFVYLLSWIILHEKFIAIRIVAVIFSITGVIMMAYVDGFGSPSMWGVIIAVGAATGSAVYKVLFKKILGEVTYCQVSIFFTFLGLCNIVIMWPILLAVYYSNGEPMDWNNMPWGYLSGSAALALLFNLVVSFGIGITHEAFIQLGLALAVPFCVVVDLVWRNIQFDGMKIAAIVLICLGFLINMLPEKWHVRVLKFIHWKQEHHDEQVVTFHTPRSLLRATAH
ncbi:unnamed protein product [Owenia fusiformis]|uniref:Uncharacterized protein n=1 Tax=Owenia fusiformis TaxID=6347 RepID=A0A8J1XRX0_OWEFU|nr:unnamed protein product [Owenia fusiformis]